MISDPRLVYSFVGALRKNAEYTNIAEFYVPEFVVGDSEFICCQIAVRRAPPFSGHRTFRVTVPTPERRAAISSIILIDYLPYSTVRI